MTAEIGNTYMRSELFYMFTTVIVLIQHNIRARLILTSARVIVYESIVHYPYVYGSCIIVVNSPDNLQ